MAQQQTRYFKARESVASHYYYLVTGKLYRVTEQLDPVDRLVEGGILHELIGPLSADAEDEAITIHEDWFRELPPPPVPSPLLTEAEVAARLGVSLQEFKELPDFPDASVHNYREDEGGLRITPMWRWPRIEAWLERHRAGFRIAERSGMFTRLGERLSTALRSAKP